MADKKEDQFNQSVLPVQVRCSIIITITTLHIKLREKVLSVNFPF